MERTLDLRSTTVRVLVATAVALALLFALSGSMASAQSDDYEEQPTSTVATTPDTEATTTVADDYEAQPDADQESLPVTGSDVGGLVVLGGGLVAAGGVLVLARRRRSA